MKSVRPAREHRRAAPADAWRYAAHEQGRDMNSRCRRRSRRASKLTECMSLRRVLDDEEITNGLRTRPRASAGRRVSTLPSGSSKIAAGYQRSTPKDRYPCDVRVTVWWGPPWGPANVLAGSMDGPGAESLPFRRCVYLETKASAVKLGHFPYIFGLLSYFGQRKRTLASSWHCETRMTTNRRMAPA